MSFVHTALKTKAGICFQGRHDLQGGRVGGKRREGKDLFFFSKRMREFSWDKFPHCLEGKKKEKKPNKTKNK